MKQHLLRMFFFLCLATPIVATWFAIRGIEAEIKLVKKEVKWKMIDGLDREELVLLKFTEEEQLTVLHWKHSREFQFQGEMYDIVTTEQHNDTTYYWCWWDYEETALNKQLTNLMANTLGDTPNQNEHQTKLFQFLKSLYFEADKTHFCSITHEIKQNYAHKLNLYFYTIEDIPSPPPKWLS